MARMPLFPRDRYYTKTHLWLRPLVAPTLVPAGPIEREGEGSRPSNRIEARVASETSPGSAISCVSSAALNIHLEVGLSPYSEHKLGEITFFELPEVGTELAIGDALLSVESIKTRHSFASPVRCVVVEANKAALETPSLVNIFPLETWLVRVEAPYIEPEGDSELLLAESYEAYLESIMRSS